MKARSVLPNNLIKKYALGPLPAFTVASRSNLFGE